MPARVLGARVFQLTVVPGALCPSKHLRNSHVLQIGAFVSLLFLLVLTSYFYLHIMLWVIILNPCELNVLIASLTNYFYTTLSEEDFICLGIFLRELSKSMISTTVFDELCFKEKQ